MNFNIVSILNMKYFLTNDQEICMNNFYWILYSKDFSLKIQPQGLI